MADVFTAEEDPRFVSFDEFEDVVVALELVAMLATDVRERPQLWKWIVLGMQNAVQGAMVVALAGTDGCGALAPKSQARNRQWLDSPSNVRPARVMAVYPELLARIQEPRLMDMPLSLSPDEQRHLERLNEVRRGFAHFNPTAWGIEIEYLLRIMPVALSTVECLLGRDRPLHLSDDQTTRIAGALATARYSFTRVRD